MRTLRKDLAAGVVVYLVALPLCLGIALASGAPLFSGIISGIIAGCIVAWLSGSELSVSGPAAGLTVIVAQGVTEQGSFAAFLAVLLVAGVLQMLMGLFRIGEISSFFPTSVVKGMLAAIGITIIIKQVPHALGGLSNFADEGANTLEVLASALSHLEWSAVFIALVSFAILIYWDKLKSSRLKQLAFFPAALVAVVVASVLNWLLGLHDETLTLRASDGHLVQIPVIHSLQELRSKLIAPDWRVFLAIKTWILGAIVAIVASIETLLCLESTDKQDPQHRISNPNRELLAQGAGNSLCALVGGLPMTSVIVRSSANVYAGAQTRMACFIHGVCLLLSVLFFASILNFIPLASLAAILIMVGYKLSHPDLFRKMLHEGSSQFYPFLITLVAILFTDLLRGVLIGFGAAAVFIIWSSYFSAFLVVHSGNDYFIKFTKDVTFIHRGKLKRELLALPANAHVVIDGSRATYIDHDIYATLEDFAWLAKARGIRIDTIDVQDKEFSKNLKRERNRGILQEIAAR